MDSERNEINTRSRKKASLSHSPDSTSDPDLSRPSTDRSKADDDDYSDDDSDDHRKSDDKPMSFQSLLSLNRMLVKMHEAEATPETSYKLQKINKLARASPLGEEVIDEQYLVNVFRMAEASPATVVEIDRILNEKPTLDS